MTDSFKNEMTNKNKSDSEFIYLPNEIFNDFLAFTPRKSHIALSTYYLICYMYRYAKYFNNNGEFNTNEKIANYLGYNRATTSLLDIIKKNGELEQIDYIRTINDYPEHYTFDPILGFQIVMASEKQKEDDRYKDITYTQIFKNRKHYSKYPVKMFYRDRESEDDSDLNGLFYQQDNSFKITTDIFMECISNKKLSHRGFYLYCYLKKYSNMHNKGLQISRSKLAKKTRIGINDIKGLIDEMIELDWISSENMLHKNQKEIADYMESKKDKVNLESNIYKVKK